MKRLAIFVEGQTEQIFVTKLITEMAGNKNIVIVQEQKIRGQNFVTIAAQKITPDTKYYVLIRDCRNDTQVKTAIIDVAERFAERGYEKILGLRDVYPKTHSEIPALVKWSNYQVPTKFLPIKILLAIMEIEAWFLAETSHFTRIHSSLTIDVIKSTLQLDPTVDSVELRPNPAKDLDDIYKKARFAYTKRKQNTIRTVNALDYPSLYLSLRTRITSLNEFISEIDLFLS